MEKLEVTQVEGTGRGRKKPTPKAGYSCTVFPTLLPLVFNFLTLSWTCLRFAYQRTLVEVGPLDVIRMPIVLVTLEIFSQHSLPHHFTCVTNFKEFFYLLRPSESKTLST